MEHKQQIRAIKKELLLDGIDMKYDDWIRSLTEGIAFLLIGSGIVIITLLVNGFCLYNNTSFLELHAGIALLVALVFLAFGIAGIIRSILQRKSKKVLFSTLDANERS